MVKILDLFEHRELRIPDRQQAFSRIHAGYIGLRPVTSLLHALLQVIQEPSSRESLHQLSWPYAGVKTTFVNLEEVGLPANDHQMMSGKNSCGISKYLENWIEKKHPLRKTTGGRESRF
jgi:hypothetical protein